MPGGPAKGPDWDLSSAPDIALGSGATLRIELGGTTPGIEYDQMHVNDQLSLGDVLAVSLVDGFEPGDDNAFDILD